MQVSSATSVRPHVAAQYNVSMLQRKTAP